MPSEPTWFGPVGRRLAGWVHTPVGTSARGAVLICPPTGLEYVNSHRALVRLADMAAHVGLVAFRFDYDGTGDSAGAMADADRVEAWRGSVRHALAYLRSVVGSAPIGVVGLRLGLTLVADVARSDSPDLLTMVAWDPVLSGRRFFREQTALGQLVGGEILPDGAIDAPGFRYEASTVEAAAELDMATLQERPAATVLVLHRSRRVPNARQLGGLGVGATIEAIDGQEEFLDVASPQATQPTATVERITAWLDATFPTTRLPFHAWYESEATFPSSDGTLVTERLLRVGPMRLVAVETVSGTAETHQSVMLLNNAVEHHVGPVRLWTDTARAWAAAGSRVVRVDLSGIGDSPTRPNGTEDVMYAPDAIADVQEFVRELNLRPDELTLVGLCSGAHLAVHAGAALSAQSVIAVNPISTEDMEPLPAGPTVKFGPRRDWPRNLLGKLKLHDAARKIARAVRALLPHLPAFMWRLAVGTRLAHSPATGLTALTDTETLLLCGPEDSYRFLTKGKWDLRKLRSNGRFRFMAVHDLAHVPMPYRQRVLVTQIMTEFLELQRPPAPARDEAHGANAGDDLQLALSVEHDGRLGK